MKQMLLKDKEAVYHSGPYNKMNESEQWIRISDGCPNNCEFCYAPQVLEFYGIPEIERNIVKTMEMNLIARDDAISILDDLGSRKVNNKVVYYELICGIDWRYMTQEKADALKRNRFKNIRLAWDHTLYHQMKIKDCLKMLIKAGYDSKEVSVFMICNWKISYEDNLKKLDLCKVWNVKVNDCWYDNQLPPKVQPVFWTPEQIRDFRKKCRKHNQMILFGIDPELNKRSEANVRTR